MNTQYVRGVTLYKRNTKEYFKRLTQRLKRLYTPTMPTTYVIAALIQKAVRVVGSQSALARSVGVTQASVSLWSQGKRRPRIEHALAIEAATDGSVRCRDIYPELFTRSRKAGTLLEAIEGRVQRDGSQS